MAASVFNYQKALPKRRGRCVKLVVEQCAEDGTADVLHLPPVAGAGASVSAGHCGAEQKGGALQVAHHAADRAGQVGARARLTAQRALAARLAAKRLRVGLSPAEGSGTALSCSLVYNSASASAVSVVCAKSSF